MRKKSEPWSIQMGIFMLVIGLFLGSVFLFGNAYWYANVDREQCEVIHGYFESYDERRTLKDPFDVKEIYIYTSDAWKFSITGALCSNSLAREVSELRKGNEFTIVLHPNSDTVLELSTENKVLLSFERSLEILQTENKGFTFLGLFMYLCAGLGLYSVVWRLLKKKKKSRIVRKA